jgi:hypothetical protein
VQQGQQVHQGLIVLDQEQDQRHVQEQEQKHVQEQSQRQSQE